MTLSPDTATFCLLSFEGPDRYAQAGGLGVRITHLAETLAQHGFETHLLFVGDPAAPGRESSFDGRLTMKIILGIMVVIDTNEMLPIIKARSGGG